MGGMNFSRPPQAIPGQNPAPQTSMQNQPIPVNIHASGTGTGSGSFGSIGGVIQNAANSIPQNSGVAMGRALNNASTQMQSTMPMNPSMQGVSRPPQQAQVSPQMPQAPVQQMQQPQRSTPNQPMNNQAIYRSNRTW